MNISQIRDTAEMAFDELEPKVDSILANVTDQLYDADVRTKAHVMMALANPIFVPEGTTTKRCIEALNQAIRDTVEDQLAVMEGEYEITASDWDRRAVTEHLTKLITGQFDRNHYKVHA